MTQKPSNAFIAASWIALGAGMLSWFSTILSIILLTVGLWNATLLPSEKGFYAFAFLLAMFGAIAVQKNTGDAQLSTKKDS